jgi:hypothetical protein
MQVPALPPSPRHPSADRAAEALAAGQLWRAKEILWGRLRSRPFDAELYEQLGRVLLQMGDTLEAGKLLLLSGRRTPEYEGAIRLFVERYARTPWQRIAALFPATARRCAWTDLPDRARADLAALGIPESFGVDSLNTRLRSPATRAPRWVGVLVLALVVALSGVVLAVLVVHFFLES